jgi:hypothetical protein
MTNNRPHWADTAIAIFTGLMLVTYITANYFSCQQLKLTKRTFEEVQKGGTDTHDLALAAKDQAAAAKLQVEEMKKGGTDTHTLAVAAKKQADAAQRESTTTREALTSVQRAFILPGPVEVMQTGSKGSPVKFAIHWDNSGVTPARGTTHVNYRWDQKPLPADFSFPDQWEENTPHVQNPFILGPKGSTSLIVGPIPEQVIRTMPYFHIYFWGWARYRDVFAGTREHVTEFCSELLPFTMPIAADADLGTIKFRLDACPRHNCYDDACKADHQGHP